MTQRETFTAVFESVAVSAAQDLFEIVAPTDQRITINEARFAQSTEEGDAQAEMLPIAIVRGHTIAGSGGSAVTPRNLNGAGRQSAAAVKRNNTTGATTGGVAIVADAFNVASGWYYRPPANERVILQPGERIVFPMGVPADAMTMSGTIVWEEFGPLKAGT